MFQMTLHAWRNYETYAWGKNELRPVSKLPHNGSVFGSNEIGATIVDSLDTLYIMGLTEEYQKARNWIEESFSFENLVSQSKLFMTVRCRCYSKKDDIGVWIIHYGM